MWPVHLLGVLLHLPAITAFLQPCSFSYDQTSCSFWSEGTWAFWGTGNRNEPARSSLLSFGGLPCDLINIHALSLFFFFFLVIYIQVCARSALYICGRVRRRCHQALRAAHLRRNHQCVSGAECRLDGRTARDSYVDARVPRLATFVS
jgi:hypothetical protein